MKIDQNLRLRSWPVEQHYRITKNKNFDRFIFVSNGLRNWELITKYGFCWKLDNNIEFRRHAISEILNTCFETSYVNATVLEFQYLIYCGDWLLQILQNTQKKEGLNFFNDVLRLISIASAVSFNWDALGEETQLK